MRPGIAGLIVGLLVFWTHTASADESLVFPPYNLTECAAGGAEFLGWFNGAPGTLCRSGQDILGNALPDCKDGQKVVKDHGKFVCKDDIPACGADEYLAPDNQGGLKCAKVKLSCRTVEARGVGPNYVSVAECDDDEFVLNGGGYTHPDLCGYLGFLSTSMPNGNAWQVDAWGAKSPYGDYSDKDVCTLAVATCCKFVRSP
jgi:hypothetical protein